MPLNSKSPQDQSSERSYLPRLPREYYQGDAVVHWTLPIRKRARGWLSDSFQATFRELMLHAAAREGLLCPAYCLMPDHLHLLWMGLRLDSDQLNGMAFLRRYLEPALAPTTFQHQSHDHVLRSEQRRKNVFASGCRYVLNNPVRAGLVERSEEWRFIGAIVPGYPTFHPFEEKYWDKFWKEYAKARHADAGNIVRPPFNVNRAAETDWPFGMDCGSPRSLAGAEEFPSGNHCASWGDPPKSQPRYLGCYNLRRLRAHKKGDVHGGEAAAENQGDVGTRFLRLG